jgi:hypothetical protein
MSEHGSIDDFASIPDPAAGVAARPAPPASPPADPSLTRADRRRRSAVAAALAVGWIGVTVWRFGVRGDVSDLAVAGELALWTTAGAGALVLALRPSPRGMPPSLRAVQIVLAAMAIVYLGSVLARAASAPEVPLTWGSVKGCLGAANLMALGPLLLGAFALRRSFLSAPAWRGAAVGAVCGLGGAIGIQAHCPVDAASHVLLGHGLAIVGCAIAGGLLGARAGRL